MLGLLPGLRVESALLLDEPFRYTNGPLLIVSADAWAHHSGTTSNQVDVTGEKVNLTSRELPPDQSEIELAGLHTTPSVKVKPPRVADAPAALECKVRQIIPVGDGPISGNLVIGEVVMIHVADAVLDANGRPDPRKLRTIARLGGDFWCHTSDLFELKRP